MNLWNVSTNRCREIVEGQLAAFTVHGWEPITTGLWRDGRGRDAAGNLRHFRLFDDGRVILR